MLKKYLVFFIISTLILINCPYGKLYATDDVIKPFGSVWSTDISGYDLSTKGDILPTLTFNSDQIWPSSNKMPVGFDPKKIIEWGKDPGLGIRKLHTEGYTGKGVNVAYIDQPLLTGHIEYKDADIKYFKIRPETVGMETSMHGPSVLSLLAGKDIGVAPKSTVYFFGHPAWLADQRTHAEALRKLIEINKTLPDDKKIKVVGFSDGVDTSEKYPEEFTKAIQEAEDSGIMVITVDNYYNLAPLYIAPFKDKDDFSNYEVADWAKGQTSYNGRFFVPSSGRTTANGYGGDVKKYTYWSSGGLSWTVPYVVGVITLGLQVDPTLTKENIIQYLNETAIPYLGGKIINAEGFVKLVKKNKELKDKDYYYILYNSDRTSFNDIIAINSYADKVSDSKYNTILVDTAEFSSACDTYRYLKSTSLKQKGRLKGIQIFGSSSDVPSFDIHYKVKLQTGIDDSGNFKSDLFYSSFNSDVNALSNDFSIYKAFEEKLKVNFVPEWSVARLPLGAGEIGPFINKYYDYMSTTKNKQNAPYINFSNPIFPQTVHSDDMSYFIKEKLDKEFKILKSNNYKLYGNKEGLYPVTTDVSGGFDNANLKSENEKGIANFLINSHGQEDNIDKCIYINPNDFPKYKDSIRISNPYNGNKDLLELRVSFLNLTNINTILSKNYYTLTLWTCLNGCDLKNNTLAHEALAKGKAIDVMAASSIISNNGVNNNASLEELKKNNFYYFMYEFFNYQSEGYSRSDSFFNAKRLYAAEILKNTDKLGEGNYEYNMHNVLSYHYLGLIDIPQSQNTGMIKLPQKDIIPEAGDENSQVASGHISFKDNNLKYNKIDYKIDNPDKEYAVNDVGISNDENMVYIRIKYSSPKNDSLCLFLQGDAPGLNEFVSDGTRKGDNVIVLSFSKDEFNRFKAGLAINIGSRNFIFINMQ